jgi:hypothetical protein
MYKLSYSYLQIIMASFNNQNNNNNNNMNSSLTIQLPNDFSNDEYDISKSNFREFSQTNSVVRLDSSELSINNEPLTPESKEDDDYHHDVNDLTQNKVNNDSNISYITCAILFTILVIALITGSIAYLVFGIIFLVNDFDISNDCKGSNLWAYVLTSIILSSTNTSLISKNERDKSDSDLSYMKIIVAVICNIIINSALAIWGGIEIWNKSCHDLQDSNLWDFALSTFILQLFACAIFLTILIYSLIIISYP